MKRGFPSRQPPGFGRTDALAMEYYVHACGIFSAWFHRHLNAALEPMTEVSSLPLFATCCMLCIMLTRGTAARHRPRRWNVLRAGGNLSCAGHHHTATTVLVIRRTLLGVLSRPSFANETPRAAGWFTLLKPHARPAVDRCLPTYPPRPLQVCVSGARSGDHREHESPFLCVCVRLIFFLALVVVLEY